MSSVPHFEIAPHGIAPVIPVSDDTTFKEPLTKPLTPSERALELSRKRKATEWMVNNRTRDDVSIYLQELNKIKTEMTALGISDQEYEQNTRQSPLH